MSGIRVSPNSSSKLLPLQLLADYVTGHVGSPNEQKDAASNICRVIVCGNTVDMQSSLEASEDAKNHGESSKASSSSSSSSTSTSSHNSMETEAEPLRVADNLLSQFARSVCIDVMPGPGDPANVALPQQPLHQCLFPRSSGYRDGFQLVTNPYKCEVNGQMLLGHSGQPVFDIARYSNVGQNQPEDGLDLAILEATLKWQHLAPTAPDTLACFPFKQRDPFVLSGRCPDVMYTANATKFATKLVTMDNGRTVGIPFFFFLFI